jgi:hypothetical protein
MGWRRVSTLVTAVALGACSTTPLGPSVTVLPGAGKSLEQFQVDDTGCRQWAVQQLGPTSGENEWMTQRRYDIGYQQCMYARGHQIPGGPRPTVVGPRVPVPPASAGTPPPDAPRPLPAPTQR